MHVDAHAGKARRDVAQHLRQQRVGHVVRGADAHHARHRPVAQVAQRLVVDRQHLPRVAQQPRAVGREALAPALLFEERVADLRLQPLHLVGDGRLRAPQVHGRGGEAALGVDGGQRAQQFEIERVHS